MRILLGGCLGRMGRAVTEQAAAAGDTVAAGIDTAPGKAAYPIYTSPAACKEEADVVIDFSNPSALAAELEYVTAKGLPLVLCTTGLSEEQIAAVKQAATQVPVFFSSNMSLGVALLMVVVLAIQLPILFHADLSKVRMALTLPFLLPTVVGAMGAGMLGAGSEEFVARAEALVASVGFVPILLAGVAVVAVFYFASYCVSLRLYSHREL